MRHEYEAVAYSCHMPHTPCLRRQDVVWNQEFGMLARNRPAKKRSILCHASDAAAAT